MNIILFGQMGAGKTTVAKILCEKYNYLKFSLGGKIHSECAFHGKESREEMQAYGQAMRQIFGPDVWNQWLFNKADTEPLMKMGCIVIDDGRQLNEYDYWRGKGFLCVSVFATEDQRIERLEKRNGRKTTSKELMHDTELQAVKCMNSCRYEIENIGTLEDLEETIETFMRLIKNVGGKK